MLSFEVSPLPLRIDAPADLDEAVFVLHHIEALLRGYGPDRHARS